MTAMDMFEEVLAPNLHQFERGIPAISSVSHYSAIGSSIIY